MSGSGICPGETEPEDWGRKPGLVTPGGFAGAGAVCFVSDPTLCDSVSLCPARLSISGPGSPLLVLCTLLTILWTFLFPPPLRFFLLPLHLSNVRPLLPGRPPAVSPDSVPCTSPALPSPGAPSHHPGGRCPLPPASAPSPDPRALAPWSLLTPACPLSALSPLTACKRKEQDQQKERALQPKKQRLVFTDLQRRTLIAIFKENKRPSKEMQATISQQLGLELNTVSNFFMNARRRCMNRWAEEPGATPGAATATATFSKA